HAARAGHADGDNRGRGPERAPAAAGGRGDPVHRLRLSRRRRAAARRGISCHRRGARDRRRHRRDGADVDLRPQRDDDDRAGRLPVNGRGIAASAEGPSRGLSRDRAAVLWEHWARALTRRPGLALLAGGLTLACLTAPVAWLRVGLPARHWWPSQTEAGKGLDLLTRIGGAGAVQPVRIVVDWPDSVGSPPRRPRHWPARAFLSAATWLSTSTFRMTCWAECRYSWAWSSALRR